LKRSIRQLFLTIRQTEKAIVNKKGDLKGYGTVWYHPEGIVNTFWQGGNDKKTKPNP